MDDLGYVRTQGPVIIELRVSEALVLFEFLCILNDRNDVVFNDQAEQRMIWKLQGALERQLAEPFRPDYRELLKEARDDVRGEE